MCSVHLPKLPKQSGENVNLPGNCVTSDYVMKKETVMMKQQIAKSDDTYFVKISQERYKKLLSLIPIKKARYLRV